MKNSIVADVVTMLVAVIIIAGLVAGGIYLYRSYRRAMAMASLAALSSAHTVYSAPPTASFHVGQDPNNPVSMRPADTMHLNIAVHDPNGVQHIILDPNEAMLY